MKILKLSLFIIISLNVNSETILYPTFDSDVYHFLGRTTSTTNTLGVSYGVSTYNGYPSDHSQTSLIVFDTTSFTNPIQSASLSLYNLPIVPGGYASFSPGAINLHEQGKAHEGASFYGVYYDIVLSDFQQGDLIQTFQVTDEGSWIDLDVTDTVNKWISSPENNHGFLLVPLSDNPFTEEENDSVGANFASTENLENIPQLSITNQPLELICQSYNKIQHANISPNENISYQWSIDLQNWNNETDVESDILLSFEENENESSNSTEITVIFDGNIPNALYYRAVID